MAGTVADSAELRGRRATERCRHGRSQKARGPADYFISSEPTDLQATTLLACAFTYVAVVILRTAPPYVGQAER